MRMLFPHAGVASSVRSTWEAARELHDVRVAGGGRLHLFRLPIAQERSVLQLLQDEDMQSKIEGALSGGIESLTGVLHTAADGVQSAPADGPTSLGIVCGSLSQDDVSRLAACYLAAFRQDAVVFPYFDVPQVLPA